MTKPNFLVSIVSRAAKSIANNLRSQWKSHLGTLAAMFAIVIGVGAWQTRDMPAGVVPDFTATMVNGQIITLSQWRAANPGQPVALHFWADWCPICRLEQNSITRVSADWPVLTIAMQSGDVAKVRTVLTQRQLPWRTALDPNGQITRSYGFKGVPAWVVVDANGQLRGASMGYTSELGMRLRLRWASVRHALFGHAQT